METIYTTPLYEYSSNSASVEFEAVIQLASYVSVEQYNNISFFVAKDNTFESLLVKSNSATVVAYNGISIINMEAPEYEDVNLVVSLLIPSMTEIPQDVATMENVPECFIMDFMRDYCIDGKQKSYSVDLTDFISYATNISDVPLKEENIDDNATHVSYGLIFDTLIDTQVLVDPTSIPPIVSVGISNGIPVMDAYKNKNQGFKYGANNMFFWEGYIYDFSGLFAIISKRINKLIYPKSTITVTGRKRRSIC